MQRQASPVVVGFDAGTTVVKAVAFDARGHAVASARRAAELLVPRAGHAESDMDRLWSVAADVLRELVATLGDARRVLGVGVSGTMGGAWLVDARNRPVRTAVLWNDGRAVDLVRGWRSNGTLGRIFEVSANAPAPGFTLPVLRHLQDHEPATLAKADVLLFCKDWLRLKLTGRRATDASDGSHAPGDVRERTFSQELFALCGVGDLVRLLPPTLDAGDVAGHITADAAGATGLAEGTPVVTGLADVSATLLGAGAVHAGMTIAVAGTSLLNCITCDVPVFEPRDLGVSFLLPGDLHARALPNQTGALAVEWAARELFGGAKPQDLEPRAAAVPAGARGLLFHPYLNSTGVIAPVYEPRARGRLFGLGIEHTRDDILRAVWEGVAYALADCYAHLPSTGPIRVVGGLARSPLWRQTVADVTGRRVETVDNPEAGALGVAVLAGVAAGMWPDVASAAAVCCRTGVTTEPDPATYDLHARRLRLYQHLRGDMTREHDLAEPR